MLTEEVRRGLETYYRAEERYEDAYAEKGRAENDIVRIQNRRRDIINEINQCNSDRRCHQRSLDKIKNAISKNNDIESSRKDAASKLETASSGFAAIGTCTTVTPKKLTDVFEEKNRSTNRMLEESFRQIKNASSSISKKIDNLDNRIRQLQNEKDEGQRRERQLREHINEQNRIIRNASFEMACNRKYLHY